jgi:hypothetical protein
MEQANWVQRNHVYLCEKQHIVQHDLTDTCLGSKFKLRSVQEMVHQLTDTEHLLNSQQIQTSTIICKNATSEIIYLDLPTKIQIPKNCHVKFSKHTITSTFSIRISSHPYNSTEPGTHSPYPQPKWTIPTTSITWFMNSEIKSTTSKQTYQIHKFLKPCSHIQLSHSTKEQYSEHPNNGPSGIQMVIFRTLLVSVYQMVRFWDARFYNICPVFKS